MRMKESFNEYLDNLIAPYIEAQLSKFSTALSPSNTRKILGVRVPVIKKLAKDIANNTSPKYFQANFSDVDFDSAEKVLIFGFGICYLKKLENEELRKELLRLYTDLVSSWFECDGIAMALKVVNKHKAEYQSFVNELVNTKSTYKIRFAMVLILSYFFEEDYFEWLKNILTSIQNFYLKVFSNNYSKSDVYYIRMGIAWMLCTLFIKNKGSNKIIKLVKNSIVDQDIIKMLKQKMRDSRRTVDICNNIDSVFS